LAPLAGVIFLWLAYADLRAWRGSTERPLMSAWYLLPAAAGAIGIGVINARLYGSPFASGYDLTDAFKLSYVLPNVRRYGWWLVSVETPFALAGFGTLVIPSARLWPTRSSRHALFLFCGGVAVIWLSYLLYLPWDVWWYLRFLLPAWPMMTIGAASLIAAWHRSAAGAARAAALLVVVAIGVNGIVQAGRRDTFAVALGESKYIEVARTVESLTDPNAVIISAQHSGSIRYYAGRLTLRWDTGDPAWLDRTIDYLAAHGHHPYFVLEPQEIAVLRARSGPTNVSARLDWAPMVSFRGGAVAMYDGVHGDRGGPTVFQLPGRPSRECPIQRPAPVLE
ncbi:MAG: hypothetical protein ACRD2I_18610, partial [Vicinamibacterales bacterium]